MSARDEMTLEEKARFVSGHSFWKTESVERLAIPAATLTDGPHGVRLQLEGGDHVGLGTSEPATCFPTASATGSSWDPELLEEMGRALALEARSLGVDVLLGPGVNIKRSPLCGRNFEYFSEDPFLSGAAGAAFVRGLQSEGVGASLKHFAANNQETDRMRVDVQVDERSLRELYLPAFERVVKESRPATVMCSYNQVNGVYASQNRWLLTDVLRDEWGFDGYVVSDWGAVVDPVAAVDAGLDLEMPSTGERSPRAIVAAVEAGKLDERVLDTAIARILNVHDRLRRQRRPEAAADLDANHALARRIATESSVLLKNDRAALPLDSHAGGSIAVIGAFAETPRYQGAGSSRIHPTRVDRALEAITAATVREVQYAAGFTLDGGHDESLAADAVRLAADAEVAILFLGLPSEDESEGFDRTHLELPQSQRDLLSQVAAVNEHVVVVLSNGGVVTLGDVLPHASAVLEMWLAGQASGSAAADLLFGGAEPGGRLAETIPTSLSHTPAHVNWPGEHGVVRYGEGMFVGYRWYEATDRPVAFPFGYGLSYTEFELSDLKVEVPDPSVAHAVVEVSVQNIGEREGSEVVQVYVGDDEASVARPTRELRGFAKVRLAPGEHRRVRIELDERAFAYWGGEGWVVEPGRFTVDVAQHSGAVPLRQQIDLSVTAPLRPLDEGSTLAEWVSDPAGRLAFDEGDPGLREAFVQLSGDEMLPLFGSMPLRTVLGFVEQQSGAGFDVSAVLEDLLQRRQQIAAR